MSNSNTLKKLAVNPKVVEAIFGDDIFSLKNITFYKTEINFYDNSIYLYIELKDYPSTPPKKWKLQNFNATQMVLRIIDVEEYSCKVFFNSKKPLNLLLSEKNEQIAINIVEEKELLYFSIKAKWIYIDKIIGYKAET